MAGQQDIDKPVVEINPRDGLKSMASFILGGVGKRPCINVINQSCKLRRDVSR